MPPTEVLAQLSEAYQLISIEPIEKITRGFLSTNHVVKSGNEKYFLKHWRQTDTQKVEEVGRIERFFAKEGLPIITPLLTLEGQTFQATSEGIFSIYPHVAGRHIERDQIKNISIDSFASALATMHKLSGWEQLNIQDHCKPWNREAFFQTADEVEATVNSLAVHGPFEKLTLKVISGKRKLLDKETRTYQNFGFVHETLCHGDWTIDNVFFDSKGELSHIFDLEKAEIGPRALELARSTEYSFVDGNFSARNLSQAAHYIGKYAHLTGLSKDETRRGIEAHYIKDLHSLWVPKEHYLKGNTRVDQFLLKTATTLDFLSENLNFYLDQLTSQI